MNIYWIYFMYSLDSMNRWKEDIRIAYSLDETCCSIRKFQTHHHMYK